MSSKDTLAQRFAIYIDQAESVDELTVEGRLTRIVGLKMEAVGFTAALGTKCLIDVANNPIEAEVVGFSGENIFLMTADNTIGITPGARVVPLGHTTEVAVGKNLLGRVVDGAGKPLDGLGPIRTHEYYPLIGKPINPLQRHQIHQPLDVGIRAINALLTLGRGQRMGLFAGSGVGKSILLGMMTRFTEADVIVVGLIGERGREVKEFIENILLAEGRRRAVVVAAPADTSPLMRLHGALLATTVAEYFRDQGSHVLLLLDSLTRYAQAQRELALSIGEPPTTKGYAPSVFAKMAQLVERAGNSADGRGSITALYTVLAEGDDQQDPIADAARAILDGHIVLARRLAESGHYPAIDIEASISRLLPTIADRAQQREAQQFRQVYSYYQQHRDLVKLGAYQRGSDSQLDLAIATHPLMQKFLQQDMHEQVSYEESLQKLSELTRQLIIDNKG